MRNREVLKRVNSQNEGDWENPQKIFPFCFPSLRLSSLSCFTMGYTRQYAEYDDDEEVINEARNCSFVFKLNSLSLGGGEYSGLSISC